jgi:hypothetical protein
LLIDVKDGSTRAQPMGKGTVMKYLFTGVALAALIGLAPAAMAQYSSGAQPGSTGLSTSDTRSGPGRGAAEGSKGTASGTTQNVPGSGMATGGASSGVAGSDNTRSSMSGTGTTGSSMGAGTGMGTSSGQARRGGREEDMTRELNLQELSRVRGAAGG